jgi:hypothetical protein
MKIANFAGEAMRKADFGIENSFVTYADFKTLPSSKGWRIPPQTCGGTSFLAHF